MNKIKTLIKTLKVKIEIPYRPDLVIEMKESENIYLVKDWRDGNYEIDDVISECNEVLSALRDFNRKYRPEVINTAEELYY